MPEILTIWICRKCATRVVYLPDLELVYCLCQKFRVDGDEGVVIEELKDAYDFEGVEPV